MAKYGYCDLHRHDEWSTFDGFGKAEELAELAKELGYVALGISNHGVTSGLVKHYEACKNAGIKPILGVEAYFLPKAQEKTRGYHLCLFAKNLKGYENLNKIQYEGEKKKYYSPIPDLDDLRKFREGVICSSACIAGFIPQALLRGNKKMAIKMAKEMKKIFGEDFYIEIQPYKIDEKRTQEKINLELIKLAEELDIKCIITSDSHRGREEDFDTYIKMHQIGNHDKFDIIGTYSDRYMPSEKDIMNRFYKMHKGDFGEEKAKRYAIQFVKNVKEIVDKVEEDIFKDLPKGLPTFDEEQDSDEMLKRMCIEGLKKRGKWNKQYKERLLEELEVISELGFSDYFLMVSDYTNYAKSKGIAVGPGRGSACNCLVSWAMFITDSDPIYFDLDYKRFIRKDKKKMPDIDLDFQTSRRQEVIEYLLKRYKGKAAQIASYGAYKVDNLINDLAKHCGLPIDKDVDETDIKINKQVIAEIKKHCSSYLEDGGGKILPGFIDDEMTIYYNKKYDNICKHFRKLYGKIRYIGTHAAGVAIVKEDLLKYSSIRIDKEGKEYICYDLSDAEKINIAKFDILGLTTMETLSTLRKETGNTGERDYKMMISDEKVMKAFREGNTSGVFQFESGSAKKILKEIRPTTFGDLCAANSLNRPGPLGTKMHEKYAKNKRDFDEGHFELKGDFFGSLSETYGTIIYQEQVQHLATRFGGMLWTDADVLIKMGSGAYDQAAAHKVRLEFIDKYKDNFVKNAVKGGADKKSAEKIFDDFFTYSFNKGHGTGYALIALEEMWYKMNYPVLYWGMKLRDQHKEELEMSFKENAIKDGAILFLPHVNYENGQKYYIRKVDGEDCIQMGLSSIKGVGEKAAQYILEERKKGIFTSYDDFYDRCKSRTVTSRVIDILQEQGALEFKKETYIKRVTKYNSSLYAKTATM